MTPWWLYVPPSRALSTPSSHVHRLESTLRHSLSKPHKPSGLHHVFPRPRSRPPSASRSYVVVAEITAVFCFDRHPRRSVRQSSPTQPKLFNCNHAPPSVVSARTSVHYLDAMCLHDPVTARSRLLQALYARRHPCRTMSILINLASCYSIKHIRRTNNSCNT